MRCPAPPSAKNPAATADPSELFNKCLSKLKIRCHPEGRVVCAPKDLNLKSRKFSGPTPPWPFVITSLPPHRRVFPQHPQLTRRFPNLFQRKLQMLRFLRFHVQ